MKIIIFILILFLAKISQAQTEIDGLMLNKNLFCAGAIYSSASWKNYWEGTFKRENLNLGTITTQATIIGANYGLNNNLNILTNAMYVQTKASAGQLSGQKGLQDLSLHIKWNAYQKKIKGGTFNFFAIVGSSIPLGNYTPDLLPLSIGLQSKTAIARLMVDYQKNKWFTTLSGSYTYRGNVKLDRNVYYTTKMHYTNIVEMPNAIHFNLRAGYRGGNWIIQAYSNKFTSLSGFDIAKNNMPFVSNKMNATTIGLHIKYLATFLKGLEVVAEGYSTVAGRNVGQTKAINGGLFYLMNFNKKNKNPKIKS